MRRPPNQQAGQARAWRGPVGTCAYLGAAAFVCSVAAGAQGLRSSALNTGSPTTSLVGIVGDSLHGGPLAGAVVMLDGQPREAVTDSIGRFRIDNVAAGRYRVGIFHPILDSLGTSLASQPVRFRAGKPLLISMATPSGRTIRRAVCPEVPPHTPRYEHADSGVAVLVGRVLDSESDAAVPDASVTLSWVETAFNGSTIRVTTYHRNTTTDVTGEFRFCALPSGLSGLLRATAGPDSTSGVERELGLDNRIVTMATMHLAMPLATSESKPRGQAVLTGEVYRPDGSPLAGATAFIEGTADSAITSRDGTFTMRGLPLGTHMVLVRSVGFEPVSDVVELTNREPQHVSLELSTPAHVLSPVLVEAQRLLKGYRRVGFDRRQRAGVGQFLTADQIAAKHAEEFSQLFGGTTGLQLEYTPGGRNLVNSRGADACLVYVLDGQPFNRMINGELDALYRPDEIGGIEVYSGASTPVEFRVRSLPGRSVTGAPTQGSDGCATVVVWTKTHLGVTQDDK